MKAKIIANGETARLELEPENSTEAKALESILWLTIPLARSHEMGRLANIHYDSEVSTKNKRVFVIT